MRDRRGGVDHSQPLSRIARIPGGALTGKLLDARGGEGIDFDRGGIEQRVVDRAQSLGLLDDRARLAFIDVAAEAN